MRHVMSWLAAVAVCVAAAGAGEVGPRGVVGTDAKWTAAESGRFARRVIVTKRSSAGVQAACDAAGGAGATLIYLPPGRYVFDATVKVPAGLTLIGAGSKTVCAAAGPRTHLFETAGDGVRFTRLKLVGADATEANTNDSYGIDVRGSQNVRIDHCELSGFSYATTFADECTAQVDHCHIHHNLRAGLGYGVAIYSGAYVLVTDNRFAQNRHSLASNGTLNWSSPKHLGKYVHKPGRKTHWEFVRNLVGTNDASKYELCAVDTHPGMDGTFVIEGNVFEGCRLAVGIRDGSGIIRGNRFREPHSKAGRSLTGILVRYGKHNDIPVEGCMPNNIRIEGNTFQAKAGIKYSRYSIGRAENVWIDGERVESTKGGRAAPAIPRLKAMAADGVLRWRVRERPGGDESPASRPAR